MLYIDNTNSKTIGQIFKAFMARCKAEPQPSAKENKYGEPVVGDGFVLPTSSAAHMQRYLFTGFAWRSTGKGEDRKRYKDYVFSYRCLVCSDLTECVVRRGAKSVNRTCPEHRGQSARAPRSSVLRDSRGAVLAPVQTTVENVARMLSLVGDDVPLEAFVSTAMDLIPAGQEGKRDTRRQRIMRSIRRLSVRDTHKIWLEGDRIYFD